MNKTLDKENEKDIWITRFPKESTEEYKVTTKVSITKKSEAYQDCIMEELSNYRQILSKKF